MGILMGQSAMIYNLILSITMFYYQRVSFFPKGIKIQNWSTSGFCIRPSKVTNGFMVQKNTGYSFLNKHKYT